MLVSWRRGNRMLPSEGEMADFEPRWTECDPKEVLGTLNEVELRNAPKRLFLAGDPGLLTSAPRVAVVGSRAASEAGLSRARKLSRMLTSGGVTVLSGLAVGIDTAAHTACIEAGGKTIGVLGTPLDKFYPASNRQLQEQIMQEHLAVSQFPSGYPAKPGCFPMRNRTMALLCDASVIVEAGEKSGSISQGWEALRLGRPLFLTRSLVESGLSWPAALLDYGANVLTEQTLDDLFATLPRPVEALAI